MIVTDKGTVKLTEQTVRELLTAIEQAKILGAGTDDSPVPQSDCNMCLQEPPPTIRMGWHIRQQFGRGIIWVESGFNGIRYEIRLENKPNTQESMGYRLNAPKDAWKKEGVKPC